MESRCRVYLYRRLALTSITSSPAIVNFLDGHRETGNYFVTEFGFVGQVDACQKQFVSDDWTSSGYLAAIAAKRLRGFLLN